MGFLDRLLNKFSGSRETEEKPTKKMELDKALDLFFQRAEKAKQGVLSDISDKEDQLEEDEKELIQAFRDLKDKEIEEEKAKGSEQAKDMYAKRALEILGSGFDSVSDLKKKIREVGRLSPREAKHLKFFFRDEMDRIAKISSRIKENIDDVNILESESILKKEKDIVSLKKEIENIEEGLDEDKNNLQDLDSKLKNVKKEKKEKNEKLSNIDLSGKKEIKDKISDLGSEKDDINQNIDSSLGSVARLLKKYQYITGNSDDLIKEYSKNPHEAFLKDEDLKIKSFLKEACQLAEEGDIDVEDKKLSRCKDILVDLDELQEKAESIKDINSKIEGLENELNNKWKKREQKKEDLKKEIEMLDKEMEHIDEKKSKLLVEINRKENKIPELKKELAEKVSSILDVKVDIV